MNEVATPRFAKVGTYTIHDLNGVTVRVLASHNQSAVRDEYLRMLNAHDALVEALRELWAQTPQIDSGYCVVCKRKAQRHYQMVGGKLGPSRCSNLDCLSLKVDAALKLAEGECPSISINENVMHGQPCISGTRITVTAVLRSVALAYLAEIERELAVREWAVRTTLADSEPEPTWIIDPRSEAEARLICSIGSDSHLVSRRAPGPWEPAE